MKHTTWLVARTDGDLRFELLAEVMFQRQRGMLSKKEVLRTYCKRERVKEHEASAALQGLAEAGLIRLSQAVGSNPTSIEATEFGESVFAKALARGQQVHAMIIGKWFPTERKARDPEESSDLVYHIILAVQTPSKLIEFPAGPAQGPKAHNQPDKPREGVLDWTLDELKSAGRILGDGSAGFLRTASGQVCRLTDPRIDFQRDSESEGTRICVTKIGSAKPSMGAGPGKT